MFTKVVSSNQPISYYGLNSKILNFLNFLINLLFYMLIYLQVNCSLIISFKFYFNIKI